MAGLRIDWFRFTSFTRFKLEHGLFGGIQTSQTGDQLFSEKYFTLHTYGCVVWHITMCVREGVCSVEYNIYNWLMCMCGRSRNPYRHFM